MGQLLPAGALVLRLAGSLLGWQEDTTSFFKKIFVKSYLQQIEAWVCLTPPPGSAQYLTGYHLVGWLADYPVGMAKFGLM